MKKINTYLATLLTALLLIVSSTASAGFYDMSRYFGGHSGFNHLALQSFFDYKPIVITRDGIRYLDNWGGGAAATDAELSASNHASLNGIDQSVEIDIPHVLGSENPNNTFDSTTDGAGNTVSTTNNVTTIHCESATSVSFYPTVKTTSTLPTDSLAYLAEFTVEITSGTARVNKIEFSDASLSWGDNKTINATIGVGVYKYTAVGYFGSTNQFNLLFDATTEFTFDATVTVSIKQITTPNSYLTYFDPATKNHVTIAHQDDAGESNVELIANTSTSWSDESEGTGTILWTGGQLELTTGVDSANEGMTAKELNTTVGATYTVVVKKASGASIVQIGNSPTSGSIYQSTNDANDVAQEFIATTTHTHITIRNYSNYNNTSIVSDTSVKEVLPISTSYEQTASFSNAFTTTVPLTNADRAYLDANPEAVARLWFGESVPQLSFTKADIYSFYPANEGVVGGQYLQNLAQDLGVELVTPDLSIFSNGGVPEVIITPTIISFSNAPVWSYFTGGILAEIGKVYIIHYKIENYVSGEFGPHVGGEYLSPTMAANGDYYYMFKATGTAVNHFNRVAIGNYDVTEVSFREATASQIKNHTNSVREDLENTNTGASNALYELDATGRIIGMAAPGTIKGGADGRSILFPMTIPNNHLLTKSINSAKGDKSELILTHPDNSTTTLH